MALFASHIRFALDLVDCKRYSPKDISQYISGTTYLSDYTYLWLSVGLSPDRTEAVMDQIKSISLSLYPII